MTLFCLALTTAYAADIDSYHPAASTFDAGNGAQVLSPRLQDNGDWYAALQLVYAHDPLVRISNEGKRESIVSDSFATHLLGAYTLFRRVRIDAHVPIYPLVGGPTSGAFSMGDIGLGATVKLVQTDMAALSLRPSLGIPSGDSANWTGAGGASGGIMAAAGITPSKSFFANANIGAAFGPESSVGDFKLGSGLRIDAGLGTHIGEHVTLGAELDSTIGLAGGVGPYNQNPVELSGYGSWQSGTGLVAMLGLGTGIVAGIGAPDARIVGGIGWHHPGKPPVKDTDKDGVMDPDDGCVEEPEDMDGNADTDGCPDPDNDKDGILDASDGCPVMAEDRDGFEDVDGCPETDNDGDTILDESDACPLQPGPEELEGCPDKDGDHIADRDDTCPDIAGTTTGAGCPDRDADRVPDMLDKCPDQPRDAREELSRSDGCPKRVIVTADKIEILEKVFFDTGKSTIKKESFGLLDDVAKTFIGNPDIKKVEVAGHTDNAGVPAKNLTLSQGRADAVVKYLISKGVAAERLVGKGYGDTKPIDTNDNEPGRSKNRRVEFTIVEH